MSIVNAMAGMAMMPMMILSIVIIVALNTNLGSPLGQLGFVLMGSHVNIHTLLQKETGIALQTIGAFIVVTLI
jgi:hypothetical protein